MLVSTVIPTYNRAKDVVVAVESALAQTHARQEILVVDDGSTDDTEAVLARYRDRIRYLRKVNGGVSAARNHGITEARGEAVAFLDSDDAWMPEKLAAQVEVMRARPEVALVMTSMMVVDEQGKDIAPFSRRTTIPEDGNVLRHVLKNPAMTPSTVMVRTEVARAIGGFDATLRTAEDLDFHLKVAIEHDEAVVDRPLIKYTRAEGSLGSQLRSYRDYITVMERFMAHHADQLDPEAVRDALLRAYVKNGNGLARGGDYRGALELGARALTRVRSGSDAAALGTLGLTLGRTLAARARARLINR